MTGRYDVALVWEGGGSPLRGHLAWEVGRMSVCMVGMMLHTSEK